MKVLFFARHYTYFRLFESVIVELARRGHEVRLIADREESMGGRRMVETLSAQQPRITLGTTPGRAGTAWGDVARRLRLGTDFLRFLDPQYDTTPHLRARARARAPQSLVHVAERLGSDLARRRLAHALRTLERGIPVRRDLRAFIQKESADVVLVTPLVELGSPQTDHLAAAQSIGARTVLPVASWDHLSSKALIRDAPNLVLVWNDIQRLEAITMHGIAPERIVTTGAHCYDQWFDRAPSRSREEFCRRVGLDWNRPYVLYLCSSLFRGTANEQAFLEQWMGAIRASSDPRIRDLGILIRPHPGRPDETASLDLAGYTNVAFWGEHPVHDEAKDDYFDSMYFSAAVVGLNTSAFLEAAIVGKPVHTVLLEGISSNNQEGTLHFRYLMELDGGLLWVARNFDDHLRLLAESMATSAGGDQKARRFVKGFIRPFGMSTPGTPRLVDALESLAATPASRPAESALIGPIMRLPLYPAVAVQQLGLAFQPPLQRAASRWRRRYKHVHRLAFTRLKRVAQGISERRS